MPGIVIDRFFYRYVTWLYHKPWENIKNDMIFFSHFVRESSLSNRIQSRSQNFWLWSQGRLATTQLPRGIWDTQNRNEQGGFILLLKDGAGILFKNYSKVIYRATAIEWILKSLSWMNLQCSWKQILKVLIKSWQFMKFFYSLSLILSLFK